MVSFKQCQKELAQENPHMHNPDLSEQLVAKFEALSTTEKFPYINEAMKAREEYILGISGYRYRPRRKRRNYSAAAQTIATSMSVSEPVHTFCVYGAASYSLADTDSGISSMSDSSPGLSPITQRLTSISPSNSLMCVSEFEEISIQPIATQCSLRPSAYLDLAVPKYPSDCTKIQCQQQATASLELLPQIQTHHHHHHQQAQAIPAAIQPLPLDHAQVAEGVLAPSVASTGGCSNTPTPSFQLQDPIPQLK